MQYEGTNGPRNIQVQGGQTFSWRSDGSVTNSGWTICWTAAGEVNTLASMARSRTALCQGTRLLSTLRENSGPAQNDGQGFALG